MGDYELFTTTTAHELWDRIDLAAERFVAVAERVTPDLPVRHSTWRAQQVVGHVLTVLRRYTQGPTLGETPRDVDRINQDELAALGDIAYADLLTQLRTELKLARELFAPESLDLHFRVGFHGGADIDLAAALSNLIGEFLIHGRDVARSAGLPWRLDPRDAVLILNGVVQILPSYAVRSATRTMRVAISVPDARRWMLDFDRGTLTSRAAEAHERADVVLHAPAETFALVLYSRLSTPQALRAGMRVVGGRRPWRVRSLPHLLERP